MTGTHPHIYMYAGPELCPHLHYLHDMMYILLTLISPVVPNATESPDGRLIDGRQKSG